MRFKLPTVAMILALTLVHAEKAFGQAATAAQAKPAARISAFIDVNFGAVFPAQDAFTSKGSYALPYFDEAWSRSYDYTVRTMKGIDVSGGVLFTSNLGVGVALSSVGSGAPPTVTSTGPSFEAPYAFQTTTFVPEWESKRHETSVHLSFVFEPTARSSKFQVRLYGGPTYFSVSQDLLDSSLSREPTTASTSAWGYHVGGDIGYFFAKHIGLGGGVRYAGATVTIPDTAMDRYSSEGHTQDVRVGGLSLAFGLRVRF